MEERDLENIISLAWKEAEEEKGKKAIKILELALDEFPNEQDRIQFELAQIYFRERKDFKALELFENCYNKNPNEEILEFLSQCYYEPNLNDFKIKYNRNTEILQSYEYFYGNISEFDNKNRKIFWYDNNKITYYMNNKIITKKWDKMNVEPSKCIVMLMNVCDVDSILLWEKETYVDEQCFTAKKPIYVYYDEDIFEILMNFIDFERITQKFRIVIIVGKKELKNYFRDLQTLVPSKIIGTNINQDILEEIDDIVIEKAKYYNKCKKENEEYYNTNKEKIIENIKSNHPRILVLTSRFTATLQYHARDCVYAAEKLGIPSRLSIEKSDIHRILNYAYVINEFKPDIIFSLNHFRFEDEDIPDNAFFVTWIQDPMPYVMDKSTPAKLKERDFILNHFFSWSKLQDIAYPKKKILDAPVPANPEKYKKYIITEEDIKKYSCDICFVCHASNFETFLNETASIFLDERIQKNVKLVVNEYYKDVYLNGRILYSKEQFKNFFLKILRKNNEFLSDSVMNILLDQMYWLNLRIFRNVLIDWIIDAGYKNIKLWGNGWSKEAKYKEFAMGIAQNGEELSKIYQCSKINIGNNIVITAATRTFECMLSGGFYMANYIPEEFDMSNVRTIYNKDELVMFFDKEDLLKKIKYYLENDEERERMIEIGRKCTLEKMTFEKLMKKTVEFIGSSY